jgi:hypothetical protein
MLYYMLLFHKLIFGVSKYTYSLIDSYDSVATYTLFVLQTAECINYFCYEFLINTPTFVFFSM